MIRLGDILNEIIEEKDDRCLRIARRKYDKPSAYRSGAIVRCRQGKIWKGLKEVTQNDTVENIVKAFVNSEIGRKYSKHDCKSVTRAFIEWATDNGIETKIITFPPPSAEFIKQHPEFKGKSGEGDGHIMPIVNNQAIDFTVRQFGIDRPYQNPLITPLSNIKSVYSKFGYFTNKPEWFDGGKTHWIGSLSSIPSDIFNQDFGDEILEGITEEKESLHKWFSRQGGSGGSKGWVDCNTCREVDGKTKCKSCGRQKGEKRSKYPSCRPTPSACKDPGKGKKWGKTK